eukprot:scaffold63729_cov36-Phaeocystis_antarctica.AAC.3
MRARSASAVYSQRVSMQPETRGSAISGSNHSSERVLLVQEISVVPRIVRRRRNDDERRPAARRLSWGRKK